MAGAIGGGRLSRDDFKKQKELEELRKTGSAPPELDEDGKMINPHIPQYISQAPWYLNASRPGLKHQRSSHFEALKQVASIDQHYARGQKRARANKSFVKGACENCGATTHKTKDCCDRPRARGAKLTGQDIAADEVVTSLQFDYEGKRDRWNGWDSAEYKKVIDHYERLEAERRALKQKEMDARYDARKQRRADRKARHEEKQKKRDERAASRAAGEALDSDSDSDSDTDSDDEEDDMRDTGEVIQTRDTRSKDLTNRVTVRNLRLREDTAKYLRNLNVNSAYYDPKTRSMRESPYPNQAPEEVDFAGDNFMRRSGDARQVQALQSFVWEAAERSADAVTAEANPSAAELMYKQYLEKKKELKENKKSAFLEKYGGAEHLDVPAAELLLNQTEAYLEYSEDGKVIKGQEKAIPKSKWSEDVIESNHTEVWGSYYSMADGKWGYKCCHATLRNSYCTGKAGKEAAAAIRASLMAPPPPRLKADTQTKAGSGSGASTQDGDDSDERAKKRRKLDDASDSGSDSDSSRKSQAKRAARKAAIRAAAADLKAAKQAAKAQAQSDHRPSAYTSAPSAAEMEAYMASKTNSDDPMAKLLGKDELLQ